MKILEKNGNKAYENSKSAAKPVLRGSVRKRNISNKPVLSIILKDTTLMAEAQKSKSARLQS